MSAGLPSPVDLPAPPEDPAGLAEVVDTLRAVAFSTGVLAGNLIGPSGSAPGWLGADAAAAAEQVVRTARIAGDVHEALASALDRLSAHHDVLMAALGRLRALRAEQVDDFAATRLQLDRLAQAAGGGLPDAAAVLTVLERLTAEETARASAHTALLDEVADDAAETAGVLADAGAGVGGHGAPGDSDRVVTYLATRLPGWGDQELAGLGVALAAQLSGRGTRAELDRLAQGSAPYITNPVFARTLLLRLGPDGLRYLLTVIGEQPAAAPGPLAATLASALQAAARLGASTEADPDPLDSVLLGRYVDARDPDTTPDRVAAGMGAVLLASGAAGPPADIVAAWGRQVLTRERTQGAAGSDRLGGGGPDPVPLIVDRLAASADPAAAASLLSVRDSWDVLLRRSWDDGGTTLAGVVAAAGREPGQAGADAVRAGLQALGAGLTDESGGRWTVDRQTAAGVAPALGEAVTGHLDLLTGLLASGLEPRRPGVADDIALRGLGYLAIDQQAAGQIDDALTGWARDHPVPPSPGVLPIPGAALLGGYLAVRNYGQRLAYALHGFEEREKAFDRWLNWEIFLGWTDYLPKLWGALIGVGADAARTYFRADGTWDNGVDRGLVLGWQDAARRAVSSVPGGDETAAAERAGQAASAFARMAGVLGTPRPPEPPAADPMAPGGDPPPVEDPDEKSKESGERPIPPRQLPH
jgi:hypothetical protein